jgi:hypothetical protein
MEEESEGSDVADVSHGPASDVADSETASDVADSETASDVADSETDSDVADTDVADSDTDTDSDTWDSEGSEGAGWFADPDVEGQERYFDGSEWTSETRAADPDAPLAHLPEHTGELQRALAAATADIDDVEDRLGSLFDRAEQHGERGGRARKQVAAETAGRAAEGQALADSVSQEPAGSGDEAADGDGSASGFSGEDDDDDALPELDEDLASEEPEKVKKGLFRRRS